MAISSQYGANPDYFGHADYAANLSAGYSPLQIYQYLQANPSRLRGSNVPGAGGLFEYAAGQAQSYVSSNLQKQLEEQAARYASLQKEQEARMAAMQQQLRQSQSQAAPSIEVTGVKGAAGAAMRIAGRSTGSAFGRTGLQIQSINI